MFVKSPVFMGLFTGAWAVGCAVVILCLFARDRSQRFARGQQCENAHCELCVTRFTRKNSVKENYRSVSTCPSMGGSTEPDAAWSSINRFRDSEGLDPYQAPSGKHQFLAAVALIVISLFLTLML